MRAARAWAKKTVSIRNAASRSAIAAPGSSGEAKKPPCYGWRMQGPTLRLETLSDDDLLAPLADVLLRGRRVEAELVWHLAEVDRRRLYLREACPSMHVYVTQRLRMSDAEAYLRITVARVSRRFPVVLAMLADGRLHLSAIAKPAPHLRDEGEDVGEDAGALLARGPGHPGSDRARPLQGPVHGRRRTPRQDRPRPGAPPPSGPGRRPRGRLRSRHDASRPRARAGPVRRDVESAQDGERDRPDSVIAADPGSDPAHGVDARRRAMHVPRPPGAALPGARAARVPSRGPVCAGWRSQRVQCHLAVRR